MRNKVLVLVTAMLSSAFCHVTGYHIEPVKASWSGWTAIQNNYVSQTVTCCWDSLERVEFFAGTKGNGGVYTAIVYEGGAELTRSAGNGVPDHGWVKFSNWDQQAAFTKGKQLTIKFTRGGNISVHLYCNYRATRYGSMAAAEELDSSPAKLRIA